jgi:hypothetical protein
MPMPSNITLASVNEAIENATILTDNNVKEQLYESELYDCEHEVALYPGRDRMSIKGDKVNGPIPLKDYAKTQLHLQHRITE